MLASHLHAGKPSHASYVRHLPRLRWPATDCLGMSFVTVWGSGWWLKLLACGSTAKWMRHCDEFASHRCCAKHQACQKYARIRIKTGDSLQTKLRSQDPSASERSLPILYSLFSMISKSVSSAGHGKIGYRLTVYKLPKSSLSMVFIMKSSQASSGADCACATKALGCWI